MAVGLAAWLFGLTLIAALVVAVWRLWPEPDASHAAEADGAAASGPADSPYRSDPGRSHERPRRP